METTYIFDYDKDIDEVIFESEEQIYERIWEIIECAIRA